MMYPPCGVVSPSPRSGEAVAGAEVESEPWGRARRRPSSEVEAGAEPRGRVRRSFLWRLRLDSAAVSLTLAGGIVVGARQAALFSCQVSQWRGEVRNVR
jgi:hypothetical protein